MHDPSPNAPLFADGYFHIGCNYWASHAGLFMWRDWRPDVVEADLSRLAAAGLTWLRVFPLWPDFQPIQQLYGQGGKAVEMRLGEAAIADDEVGRAGISPEMLARFDSFCDIAHRHGLKLVVGSITGWMSGRLFVPPALEGRDPITDPTSIAWQLRFVHAFVRNQRHHEAIAAWDLGNECNCMGSPSSPDAAYVWSAAISNTIRAADATRPIVSGMHSLSTRNNTIGNPWLIEDQGELTDVLTTHPYPYWVRHTATDAVDDLRTTHHSTAESRFYSDIGGKPCLAEEIGTMGPMIAGDEVSADFARVNMFSLWANDCPGMAWWCSHDQTELDQAPYDWNGVELELGLLRTDGSSKPVLDEMTRFRSFLDALPFAALPPPAPDAVCVLSHNQDDWAVAYSSHILAKQAKMQLAFRHVAQSLPDANLYLLPSISGPNCVPKRKWKDLLDRVEKGATLYVSLADGILPQFNEKAGVAIQRRSKGVRHRRIRLAEGTVLTLGVFDELQVNATTAEVLGRCTDDGSPLFWRQSLGLGWVYVLAAPLEQYLTTTPRAFSQAGAEHWRIYAQLLAGHPEPMTYDPDVAVTRHHLADGSSVFCLVNHSRAVKDLRLSSPIQNFEIIRGAATGQGLRIGGLDAAVLRVPRGHPLGQ